MRRAGSLWSISRAGLAAIVAAGLAVPAQAQPTTRDDGSGAFQLAQQRTVQDIRLRATTFPMPDVTGLTVEQAEEAVTAAGRAVRTTSARATVQYRDDDRPAGTIIGQGQRPGTPMRPYLDDVGGVYGQVQFNVTVSNGPQRAPSFIEMDLPSARRDARRQEINLRVAEAVPDPRTPRGIVVRQNPQPGQPMTRRTVTVWPSDGFPLPVLVEKPYTEARRDADRLGFALTARGEDRIDIPEGIVFDQNPPPGTLLPLDGPVTVGVSRGWPVPGLVGMPIDEAIDVARENRSRLRQTGQDSPEVPAGVIMAQAPPAGRRMPADRIIDVTVSRGYPLPELVGGTETEAERIAARLGFRLESRREPLPDRDIDRVDRQSPAPGTRLPFEEPVRIVVSDGWPTPDFMGRTEDAARSLATERRVSLEVTGRRQDRSAEPGTVVDQDPSAGALLPPGQPVRVVLSEGYPTPRFIELPEADAREVAAGAAIVLEATPQASREYATGIVVDQNPRPGALLPPDGRVAVIVSSGWPTPDFVGRTETEARRIAADDRIELLNDEPREHYDWDRGRVIQQRPLAGVTLPADRSVSLTYSLGWPVAPPAIGESARALAEQFTSRHPNARVVLEENFLTLQSVGSVISQRPDAGVKLGPGQRLVLVAAAPKPLWTWAALGLFVTAGAAAAIRILRPDGPPKAGQDAAEFADDTGGIHLRVTKDLGDQEISVGAEEEGTAAQAEDPVRVRVIVDLGKQSAGPVEKED